MRARCPRPPGAAGRKRSLPDPGDRCCARPDSWPGPCVPAWEWSPASPLGPPPRPASRIAARLPPSSRALRMASNAGSRASSMVLSPAAALPRCWTPSMPAWNSATTSAASSSDLAGAGNGGPKKEGAVQRPGGAAYMADEGGGYSLEDGTDIGRNMRRQFGFHRREAAVHIDAVVGIANRRIQFREPLPVLAVDLLQEVHPLQHGLLAHGHS